MAAVGGERRADNAVDGEVRVAGAGLPCVRTDEVLRLNEEICVVREDIVAEQRPNTVADQANLQNVYEQH